MGKLRKCKGGEAGGLFSLPVLNSLAKEKGPLVLFDFLFSTFSSFPS
jgi:hypothetical protein